MTEGDERWSPNLAMQTSEVSEDFGSFGSPSAKSGHFSMMTGMGESFFCPQCFCQNPLVPAVGRAMSTAPSAVPQINPVTIWSSLTC